MVRIKWLVLLDQIREGTWRFDMSPDAQVDVVADALRQRILEGEFGTGGRLPSLRMLASEFGVGYDTINSVVQRLQAEGVLISKGRAGVFVNKPRSRIPTNLARFGEYLEQLGLKAMETTLEGPSVIPAPASVARVMGLEERAPIVHRLRRMGTATTPYSLVESFYPGELVGDSMIDQARKDEQYNMLLAIKEAHGKMATVVHEDVIGRLPTSEEQRQLAIVRGTPVQEIHRVYYAQDEKTVLLYSRNVLVASYFVLSYDYVAPDM